MKRSAILLTIALALAVFGYGAHVVAQTAGPQGRWGPGMMGGYGMRQGMMGGYGSMGPGMMGGYGGMGPGMMGGYGGMGPGMMGGYGGMGPGMMGGYGGMGPGMMMGPQWYGSGTLDLSTDDVTNYFQRWLAWQGNPRLVLGMVSERDDDTITADIVTAEGSVLVQRFIVNRHTGAMWPDQG